MYQASIENRGDTKSYATTRHASFLMDTAGAGANPVDTLLASLGGCMGHYVRDYLNGQEIPHTGFAVKVEAGVTPDKTALADIRVGIDLGDLSLTDRQAAELLKYVEQCKVHRVLSAGAGVTVSLAGQRGECCC